MHVTLTTPQEDNAHCTWCEKDDRECVVASFSDGFLKDAPLCWKCLQTAMKVRARQDQKPAGKPGT
ncbi:MAG: hypothetical protein Q8K78_03820 [Planctomycetaceae bacterium]|nr:hypothetical protein [Planctomycetaceae bacterium]